VTRTTGTVGRPSPVRNSTGPSYLPSNVSCNGVDVVARPDMLVKGDEDDNRRIRATVGVVGPGDIFDGAQGAVYQAVPHADILV